MFSLGGNAVVKDILDPHRIAILILVENNERIGLNQTDVFCQGMICICSCYHFPNI